ASTPAPAPAPQRATGPADSRRQSGNGTWQVPLVNGGQRDTAIIRSPQTAVNEKPAWTTRTAPRHGPCRGAGPYQGLGEDATLFGGSARTGKATVASPPEVTSPRCVCVPSFPFPCQAARTV